jgi:hypothetical protein
LSPAEGEGDAQGGARAGLALDLQAAAEGGDLLAEGAQAEPAGVAGRRGGGGPGEAPAVVANVEDDLVI